MTIKKIVCNGHVHLFDVVSLLLLLSNTCSCVEKTTIFTKQILLGIFKLNAHMFDEV